MNIEFVAELEYNPDLLGQELDKKSKELSYISYEEFLEKRNSHIKRPIKPIITDACTEKEEIQNAEINELYNKDCYEYKKKQEFQLLLKAYSNDWRGYAQFLAKNEKSIFPFLKRRCLIPVKEKHRQLHTYITGGTGSGKSEIIKSFIWHYLTKNKSTAIVLLSPHSEICEQVARFNTHITDDRLVYIDTDLHPHKFPCLNPFDIPNKKNLTDRQVENNAENFRLVFEELLQGVFSDQMNTLLINTIPVIFKMENSSIYDLLDFLEPNGDNTQKYIDFANENFQNRNMLDFLNNQFLDKGYYKTKLGMVTRLYNIFNATLMQQFFTGKATIDIEKLINQRKIIVFNISKGKANREYQIIGKIIIATLKNIAFNREYQDKKSYAPCHFFIDECQNYITESMETILEECRKKGLYLTLAQQTIEKTETGGGLYHAILGNTGIKLTGRNGDNDTLKKMCESTGANLEQLKEQLSTGRFSLWKTALTHEKQKLPIIITAPTLTIDNNQSMTKEQWEIVKNAQIKAFYRSDDTNTPQAEQQPLKHEITACDNSINEFLN